MKTELRKWKQALCLVSLLGIGALGAGCGKSASSGVEADSGLGADPGIVQEDPPPSGQAPAESPAAEAVATPAPEEPGAGDVDPSEPVACYRYAFVSDRGGAENIFLSDTCSGEAPTRFTANTHARTHFGRLAFMPNGLSLAFDQATVSIPLLEPNAFLVRLTANPATFQPLNSGDLGAFDAGVYTPQNLAFEPAGQRVAFVGVTEHGVGLGADFRVIQVEELRLYDFDSGEERGLIVTLDERRKIDKIAWFDERRLILSMRQGTGPKRLYILDLENLGLHPLAAGLSTGPVPDAFEGSDPAIRPGGSQLTFVRRVDGRDQVFSCSFFRRRYQPVEPSICNNLRQLTNEGSNRDPAWTPDGRFLFFTSDRDGNENLYKMQPDGSGAAALTTAFSAEKAVAVHPQSFAAP